MSSVIAIIVGDRRGLGHVGRRVADLDAELGDELACVSAMSSGLPKPLSTTAEPACGQRPGDAESDAAGRAGDERDLAFQRAGRLFDTKRADALECSWA